MLIPLFLCIWAALAASQRSNYLQFQLVGNMNTPKTLQIQMGTPEQPPLKLFIGVAFSEIVLIDESCGKVSGNCPLYCQNEALSILYCTAECRRHFSTGPNMVCGLEPGRYYPNSATREELSSWRGRVGLSRHLAGNVLKDQMAIRRFSQNNLNDNTKRVSMPFISATMFDQRLLQYFANGIFGLRPGPNSSVVALCQQLNCNETVITLTITRELESVLRPITLNESALFMTVGTLDRVRCVEWDWMHSVSSDWVVEFPFVDFMGKMFSDVTIIIDQTSWYITIDVDTAKQLADDNIISPFEDNTYMVMYNYANCEEDPKVRFLDNERRSIFALGRETLIIEPGYCVSYIITDSSDSFSIPRYGRIWRLGAPFFQNFCVGFDYRELRIGFGRKRVQASQFY